MLKQVKNIIKPFAEEVLNSYSILLFSGSRALGLLLLIVSFFKPYAGFAGLVSAIIAIGVISFAGLQRSSVHKGLYSYNAVLIGIGMGTFYNPGTAFWLLLFLAVLFSVIMSGVLARILLPKGLPFLTIPFVICFWLVILVSREFTAIDFSTRNIYWLNEMYAIGDKDLVNFMMFLKTCRCPHWYLRFQVPQFFILPGKCTGRNDHIHRTPVPQPHRPYTAGLGFYSRIPLQRCGACV
ncbi:MAG: urea transporter [Chitinophagaceae bacterium]|nr:urea transporter [Chitinophagaceae bacterium]